MWSVVRFQTDLELQPILAAHLGDDTQFKQTQYSDSMLALKFVEFFQNGADKFQFSSRREDSRILEALVEKFELALADYYQLSKSTKRAWEALFGEEQKRRELLAGMVNEQTLLGLEDIEKKQFRLWAGINRHRSPLGIVRFPKLR